MVTTLTALFVVTTSILLSTGYAQAEEGKLLFRSGFEPNVYVTRDYHDIRGADGMDWQRHLEERISYAHGFTLNYCAEAPTFAWARIIDDPTSGGRGRVLHMSVVTTVGTSRSTSTISRLERFSFRRAVAARKRVRGSKDRMWTGTTGDVFRYTEERDAVRTVSLTDVSERGFRISIECDPEKVETYGRPFTELYDMPLTVQVPVPDSWNEFSVEQTGREKPGKVVEISGRKFVRLDVRPNLTPAVATVID